MHKITGSGIRPCDLGQVIYSPVIQLPYVCNEAHNSAHLTGFVLVADQFALRSLTQFSSENLFPRTLGCVQPMGVVGKRSAGQGREKPDDRSHPSLLPAPSAQPPLWRQLLLVALPPSSVMPPHPCVPSTHMPQGVVVSLQSC